MGLSTFRGFFGASGGSGPPPVFDPLYPEVGSIVGVVGSTDMYQSQPYKMSLLPSSSSRFFVAYDNISTDNIYGCMVSTHGGYNTTGVPLVINTSLTSTAIVSSSVSATGYLVLYRTGAGSGKAVVSYLTSSGATLTLATGPTDYFAASVTNVIGCAVMDSSNALILGGTTSSQTLALIDPIALTQRSTQALSLSTSNHNQPPTILLGLSSTLASLIYLANDNTTINGMSIDRSGTTVTVGGGTTLATTTNNPFFTASVVTATKVLLVYSKNNTTLGARIITVGASGSISAGAEYTFTTGVTNNNQVFQCAILSATEAIISWTNTGGISGNINNGVNIAISGTSITFDTVIYPLTTGNPVSSTVGGQLVRVSATQAAIIYAQTVGNFSGLSTPQGYASTIDYAPANPTWAATFAGTMVVSPAFAFGTTQPIPSKVLNLGSNRALIVYSSTSGTQSSGWHTVQMDTLGSNITAATSDVLKATSAGNYVAGACRIYADDATNTRVLGFYYDASNNVQFGVIYVDTDGVTTMNTTATTFTNTLNASTFNSLVVNASPNVSLYIQGSGATIGGTYKLQASVIGTSGGTVFSVPALTTIDTTAGSTYKMLPLAAQMIDAVTIAVIYQTDTAAGAQRAYNLGIIDITGGTPSLVTSALLTPALGMGAVATGHFTVGTSRGVLLYKDLAGTSTIGIGFSYTTTTITVSATPVNLGAFSSHTIAAIETNNTCGVSGTELMTALGNGGGVIQWFLITTPDIDTITLATGISLPATFQTTRTAMIPTENQNALMCATYGSSGGLVVYAGYLFKS